VRGYVPSATSAVGYLEIAIVLVRVTFADPQPATGRLFNERPEAEV